MITKSDFKYYLQCPEYFWFRHHQPDVLESATLTDFELMLAEQGKAVEAEVYKRFPETVRVRSTGEAALQETQTLIRRGVQWIAQAAFATGDFFAQADLIHVKEDGHIDLYEIKSSSRMQNAGQDEEQEVPSKEKHIADLAFQFFVLTDAGYVVDSMWLIELNKEYHLRGALDLDSLFAIHDVSIEVRDVFGDISKKMNDSLDRLRSTVQPTACGCRYLARKKQCGAFAFLYPAYREYAVFDLARIGQSKARLKSLVDDGYVLMGDIPDTYVLLDAHRDQVHTWNSGETLVRQQAITTALDGLVFPLYFLDYETTSTAIPVYEGTKPYMQVPFQYSLHIVRERNAEPEHVEYVHADRDNPMIALAWHLREHIGDSGTVIVWNKTFESKCNQNMAAVVRDLSAFLYGLNGRMYDLMEIFQKRYYVHRDFRGSHSIKKVLPVLVPGLTYSGLAIADGGTATTQWKRMVYDTMSNDERQGIKRGLLEYCKLDTLAMVEIYRCLVALREEF